MAEAHRPSDKYMSPPPSAGDAPHGARKSRSFFLIDSTTYKPHFSEQPVTVVFSNGQDLQLPRLSSPTKTMVDDSEPTYPAHRTVWGRFRSRHQDFFSEFWGVFVLILFGDGVVAQTTLSSRKNGDWFGLTWSWGVGVMMGAYVARRSGAHLNPAVTLAFCVFRKFSWKRLPIYVAAQLLGAFAASGVVYAVYKPAFDSFAGVHQLITPGSATGNPAMATAGIFATYPQPFLSSAGQFSSELVATALLLFSIFALLDEGNIGAGPYLPIGLFIVVCAIGNSFGFLTGFALNPARDLGPRLMSYVLGYGSPVWTVGRHYFWVPIFGTMAGALLGALLYDLFIYQGETPLHKPWFGLRKSSTVDLSNV